MTPMLEFRTEQVNWSVADSFGSDLWIRRLDQAHPLAPGNKAWKLRFHLERAKMQPSPALLTFGGAWSNHLHAAAAMGSSQGIRTIGVVRISRDELESHPTPTLVDCQKFGMELFPVSREEYREKNTPFFKAWLRDLFDNPWIVPEGAGDSLGVMGCQSIVTPEDIQRPWDAVVVSGGTGATAAGIAIGLRGVSPLYVGSSLKGVNMGEQIKELLQLTLNDREWSAEIMRCVIDWNDAHDGGFGKLSHGMREFILKWEAETRVPLDAVYTAKTLMRLKTQLESNANLRGKRILFIHTGGLQGNRSWR